MKNELNNIKGIIYINKDETIDPFGAAVLPPRSCPKQVLCCKVATQRGTTIFVFL